jgi:dynein heavy chain, axonemal
MQRRPGAWKKLLFNLAFFHAVVQERRKFGPLGWNIRYEFNQSDIECGMSNVLMFLEGGEEIPWDAIEFVVGQINYGGRVTDDNDRRCLMSVLRKFLLPSALDVAYQFTPSGIYYSPASEDATLEDVREYIRQLPSSEEPEVFGMHTNANIQSQLQETRKLLSTILCVQPREGESASGRTPEEIVLDMAASLHASIPRVRAARACVTRFHIFEVNGGDYWDMVQVMDKVKDAKEGLFEKCSSGKLNSLSVVLAQEVDRFNVLTTHMLSTLMDLQKAIKGIVVMSGDLELMFEALLDNKVCTRGQGSTSLGMRTRWL